MDKTLTRRDEAVPVGATVQGSVMRIAIIGAGGTR